jgi:hypothetical protein
MIVDLFRASGRLAGRVRRHVLSYDLVVPLDNTDAGYQRARSIALALLTGFVFLGACLVLLGLIDNKPTTASTGLVSAHRMVTMNWMGWFSDGMWWRGKQTPTPLPFTIHGLFFSLFGYSVRGILLLHTLVGALLAWMLFRITARRYGPWAGLLALVLCLSMPLFLYVTFSGWTFVWATMFLLLAVDLTDQAVIAKRARWFLLAGLALGCAGMSRPENYAASLLFVLLAPFKLRYRAAFFALVFTYPMAQYGVNNLFHGAAPGLRILDDARSTMGYGSLFQEWFGSVHRSIMNRNYSVLLQWLLIPAVVYFGLPKHRLLSGLLVYFWVAFFAAYAMRRNSFNHEGYYFAHVVLSPPFFAAGGVWGAAWCQRSVVRAGLAPRRAVFGSMALVIAILGLDRAALRDAYRERLFYRVPEPVQALRDALVDRLEEGDALVLDYFSEVSWMLAELEGNGGREIYFYNTNATGEPRPRLNAARKDIRDEELVAMNQWVYRNYQEWARKHPPRYLVLLSASAWERETTKRNAMGHYRMFGLRAAEAASTVRVERLFGADAPSVSGVVYANEDFVVRDTNVTAVPAPIVLEDFSRWEGSPALPRSWSARPEGGGVVSRGDAAGGGHVATLHPQPDDASQLVYAKQDGYGEAVPGAVLYAEVQFLGGESGSALLLLGFKRFNGESYNVKLENGGEEGGQTVKRLFTLPEDIVPGRMYVSLNLRAGASEAVSVSQVAIRPVYVPE